MESSSAMVPFPLLTTPIETTYRPCTIPYRFASDSPHKPTPAELVWIEVFRKSISSFRKRAELDQSVPDAEVRSAKFAERYGQILDELEADPESHGGPPDCILLCRLREQCLRELGFRDIFKKVKDEENTKALTLFEKVVQVHDDIEDGGKRLENLIRGIFAGNIFDLGAAQVKEGFFKCIGRMYDPETAAKVRIEWTKFATLKGYKQAAKADIKTMAQEDPILWWSAYGPKSTTTTLAIRLLSQLAEVFAKDGISFLASCENLLTRPWVIDDLEAFKLSWMRKSWRKAVIFVDNSGADIVLGILPFARELLRRGTQVILAANDLPSINDITYPELVEIISKVKEVKDGKEYILGVDANNLLLVNSGSDLPVIDLASVSPELAYVANDADLVILEGMGRAIETNLYAQFKCDSVKLGMVKHLEVAEFLGGRLYDCVIKYTEVVL